MAIKNTYSAETWEKVYAAFQNVNFASYDYDTVKQSLIDYLKIYHKESFNDFIESSELIALLEIFAYTVEQLAYRTDMISHENFITTAARKQSILKLAKLVSYKASRNFPATGLVKLTSIMSNEDIIDSLGTNINGRTIIWNDPNNSNWKEQFLLVMNRVLLSKFGQPDKSAQVGDVMMQLYSFNNAQNSFLNGVHNFTTVSGGDSFQMEVVPADLNDVGVFEKTPDNNNKLSLIYASDGLGDGSDYTGFLMFVKQGTLLRQDLIFTAAIPNRTVELSPINVNQIDVWLNKVDLTGATTEKWENVDSLVDQNITFNRSKKRQKFEIESLELDRIKIIFGDGDFSDIPVGNFNVWVRQSINRSIVIQKSSISNEPISFTYRAANGLSAVCEATFSLTSTIQNSSPSETIEHIRQAAPAAYYSQNRMVNGQDYNTFMLKDPSILRLKTVNRTFAGQPKYLEWNDPSGQYENIKLFGDDLRIEYRFVNNKFFVDRSGRSIIDGYIEPKLEDVQIQALHSFITSYSSFNDIDRFAKDAILPIRTKFVDDKRQLWKNNTIDMAGTEPIYAHSINGIASSPNNAKMEKTLIQGALDSHWYGEPDKYTTINGVTYAEITTSDFADDKIWSPSIPRIVDGAQIPGDVGSLRQLVSFYQSFGLKFNPFTLIIGNGTIGCFNISNQKITDAIKVKTPWYTEEVWSFVVNDDRTTVTATSNKRGKLPALPITEAGANPILMTDIMKTAPIDFYIEQGNIPFEASDSFIAFITVKSSDVSQPNPGWQIANGQYTGIYLLTRQDSMSASPVNYLRRANCSGYWDITVGGPDVTPTGEPVESVKSFDGTNSAANWTFWIKSNRDVDTDDIIGFDIYYRHLKVIVESPTTKFWYNDTDPIVDTSTNDLVYDAVKVLRSNFASDVKFAYNFDLDVIGAVTDQNGEPNYHLLEVKPTSKYARSYSSVDLIPVTQLMVDSFLPSTDAEHYRYWIIKSDSINRPETYQPKNNDFIDIFSFSDSIISQFRAWSPFSSVKTIDGVTYARTRSLSPLDFMWQHFSPYTHMIDPSVTNINDAYVLTRGYYDNVMSFVERKIASMPTPPSNLDLRTQYSQLLSHKMISDTLVLHAGKIKLLFGDLAEPELRAKFRVIKSPSGTLSIESIKKEILIVIQKFFSIENWDFGDPFYATELITAIHQRLPADINSVVIVPTYSINSFGSLFTINCGITEILQSCATLDDIEIVEQLNPITLRQS